MSRTNATAARRGGRNSFTTTQFELDPVLCAAWLYHEEGLKQDEIAAQVGISRASVYNLLQKARDEGIVSVSIDLHRMDLLRLGSELRDRAGIDECFVVPSQGSGEPLATRIARFGARLLEQRLTNDSILGVAWGRTVMALSKASFVNISLGFGPCERAISTARRPVASAAAPRRESTAGMDAVPGRHMPSASTRDVIVDAVPISLQ